MMISWYEKAVLFLSILDEIPSLSGAGKISAFEIWWLDIWNIDFWNIWILKNN